MHRYVLTLAIPLLATLAAADTINVEVRNNFFRVTSAVPGQGTNSATIQPGDTVVWTWLGSFHSVTETNALFDSGVQNIPFTYQFTFNDPGTYEYNCTVHGPHMNGLIIVSGGATPPTDIELDGGSVIENSPNGTLCGTFTTVDPDQPDGHTYTLVDDAGGRFSIVGTTLQVANGGLLDFEQNQSHTIRVRSTDATNLSFEEDFVISVANIICAEDLNTDGTVDISDLAILLSNFGRTDNPGQANGDIDGSGTVDLTDLATILSAFGQIC